LTLDDLRGLVADSEAKVARQNALPPAEAKARADYYRRRHEHEQRLTAAKRREGTGDCSREFAIASRLAAAAVSTVRPRERRDRGASSTARRNRAGRSSARSGDSGDDGGSEPPPPAGWRWTQPQAWQAPIVQPRRTRRRNNQRMAVA
jgi:hypothetical protein